MRKNRSLVSCVCILFFRMESQFPIKKDLILKSFIFLVFCWVDSLVWRLMFLLVEQKSEKNTTGRYIYKIYKNSASEKEVYVFFSKKKVLICGKWVFLCFFVFEIFFDGPDIFNRAYKILWYGPFHGFKVIWFEVRLFFLVKHVFCYFEGKNI